MTIDEWPYKTVIQFNLLYNAKCLIVVLTKYNLMVMDECVRTTTQEKFPFLSGKYYFLILTVGISQE